MNRKTYERLMAKLDSEILNLQGFHPIPNPAEFPRSVGFIITENMDIESLPKEKLPMLHTMLHLFYNKGTGKSLTKHSIVNLHKRVCNRLRTHKYFDRLDEQ